MLIGLPLVGASCASEPEGLTTAQAKASVRETLIVAPQNTVSSQSEATPSSTGDPAKGLTYQRHDGNRLIAGRGQLPNIEPLDLALSGQPLWLVAAPSGAGSIWVAIQDDGRAEAFHVTGAIVEPIAIEPPKLPPESPPMLLVADGLPSLLTVQDLEASTLTHAVRMSSHAGSLAYITVRGDLVIKDDADVNRLPVNAMPDARLLTDEFGRLLLLTDPTTRYGHGVLGDGTEAGSATLVETAPSPRVSLKLELDSEKVVEGIAPIWADLDGDGAREIIVTESDAERGARIVVYDEQGKRMAAGPAIGAGYRWSHQLAVAPFGPGGELELAAVRTPHIGGVVEFYQMRGDKLEIVVRVPGYSSHTLGSRNLDRAIAGDLDGDGHFELLVPDQAQEFLGAIRHTQDGAETAWRIPIGAKLSTNLAAVTLPNGDIALGAGREDNTLRLWLPVADRSAD